MMRRKGGAEGAGASGRGMEGGRIRRALACMTAVLVCACAVCAVIAGPLELGEGSGGLFRLPGADAASEALPASSSLADEEAGGVAPTVAASFEPESADEFREALHVQDGEGNLIAIEDVPAKDYTGFIFRLSDTAASRGADAKMADAVEQGLVRKVAGGSYAIDSLDALAGLLDADDVARVEPNYTMHLVGEVDDAALLDVLGGTDKNPAPDYPPTDQNYAAGKLWHLDMLNVEEAWELGLDGDPFVYNNTPVRDEAVRVAIIDTGLYGTGATEPEHEDFDYSKIEVGYDWIHNDAYHAGDAKGHGTFVAGLIGAKVSNNGVGVAGLMPDVVMVPEKVFDTGSASTENVINAIYHAAGYYDMKAVDVINMSLGGEYNDSELEEACNYAIDQGVLVVASAGNDGVSTPNYPAAYERVIGVASVDSSQNRSSWSQYGVSVTVTAPGESVTSTYNEGADSYTTASGTSFSGPEVAALAAMCKSVYPGIDQETFKQLLIDTSRPLGGTAQGEWNQNYGYGLVDFGAMGRAVLASQTLPWYNLSFAVTDLEGNSIEDASVVLAAAEDIAWEADAEASPSFEAGELAADTEIPQQGDGTWRVHRGAYTYTVVADGYYTATGTLRTLSENQVVAVKMPKAYPVAITVADSSGTVLEDAQLAVKSSERAEQPKGAAAGAFSYDLAAGVYDFTLTCQGYEDLSGKFVVEHEAKTIEAVMYREGELADVTFACTDAEDGKRLERGLSISVADSSSLIVSPQDDGGYRLARGKTYTATAAKIGYDNAQKTFVVDQDSQDVQVIDIQLVRAANRVTFNVVNANTGGALATASIKVADVGGNVYEPVSEGGNVFGLPIGQYTFEAQAPGFVGKQGSLSVSTSAFTMNVALVPEAQKIAFNVLDAEGAPVEGASIKVSTTQTRSSIAPSSEGLWLLTPGSYRYTVYKEGFQVAQGEFSVAGEAATIQVVLVAKPQGETKFAGGSGTEQDPYLIATEGQLRYLAESTAIVRMADASAETNVKRTVTGYYKLIADIDLTDEWTPIGNEESSSNYCRFGGVFDGDGHVVSGVRIDQPGLDYQGFFGSVVGATIRNLTVEGEGVQGKSYVGGLVGRAYYYNSSEFTSYNTPETLVSQCASKLSVMGKYAVGGIIGSAQATNDDYAGDWVDPGTGGGISVVACANEGSVMAADNGAFDHGASAAGGIVGSCQQMQVTSCYNTGDVRSGYNAGGIVGNSRLGTIVSCYNVGMVAQYVTASGYEGTAGGIAGNAYYTVMSDCYFMAREGNTGKMYYGSTDSASKYTNCSEKPYEDMFRNVAFVAAVNTNSIAGTLGNAFTVGRDFPALAWQVGEGALLAPTPRIVEEPTGVEPSDAYKETEGAKALSAKAEVVSVEGASGRLTWQWYAARDEYGRDERVIEGAHGEGGAASYVPPTDTVGATYYRCVFTNSLSTEDALDESSVSTRRVAVYVRSATDAQQPAIVKLNPSQTSSINKQVNAKAGTDATLEVVAEVADGGELSYQWYEAVSGNATPAALDGETSSTYSADTSAVGTRYYYVKITNKLEEGNEAATMSERIEVNVMPYTIESYEDLATFRSAVNGGNQFIGVTITMTDDVAIPDGVDWEPIGTQEHPFSGLFVGGAGYASSEPDKVVVHTVSNLHIDGDAHGNAFLGLFGYTLDAQIFDLKVQGSIIGASNTYAGLLVGYASTYNTSSSYAYIENCAALANSSVEGKYLVGGLVGASGSNLNNCANHAQVHAHAFARETAPTTAGLWAVGGVVGYSAGAGELMGCYNTGDVTVDAVSSGDYCAEYVGGVVGFTGAHSGIYSSFNAGMVSVGTAAPDPLTYRGKVRYAGGVAGYVSYGSTNGKNLHYLEGTCATGAGADLGDIVADYHSMAFMKTAYFVTMLASGYDGYSVSHFVRSADGVPHHAWEDDNADANSDGKLHSAEPWLIDVQSKDMPKITLTWSGTYYVGGASNPIYVLAESVDGGALSFRWEKRAVPGPEDNVGFDDNWVVLADTGETTEITYQKKTYRAGVFSIPVDAEHTAQYRCVVTNALEGAQDDTPMESATNPITIEVLDAANALVLADPNAANSADNPWIVDTPVRLKFLADVVNGKKLLPGLEDSTFAGQYLRLDADVDLSDYENWDPIGTYGDLDHSSCFQGIFDGGGHVITGLNIRRVGTEVLDGSGWYPADFTGVGLFGGTYLATIRNLEVDGSVYLDNGRYTSTTTNAWMTGGVAGYAWGTYFENVVNRASVAGYQDVGGVVGRAENSRLFNCENLGQVTVNASALKSSYMGICVGGVVGNLVQTAAGSGSGAGAYNCYSAGEVLGRITRDGDYRFGAVIGEASGGAVVANCRYAAGSVGLAEGEGRVATGIGGGNNGHAPGKDSAAKVAAVAAGEEGAAAWTLNTAGVKELGVASGHSGKWGVYARDDLHETAPAIHLVRGDASRATYRIDSASDSALITAEPAYACEGSDIAVTWESKDGFEVKSISWKTAASDAPTSLGTGETGSANFAMPGADVAFEVEADIDTSYRYGLSGLVTVDGDEQDGASCEAGSVKLSAEKARPGAEVTATIECVEGYQVKQVSAADAYGIEVAVTKVDSLHYTFTVPSADVVVTVAFETSGTEANEPAASLAVDRDALHRYTAADEYATGRLLFDTVVFSGTYYGQDKPFMAFELEGTDGRLFTQNYTFADGSSHTFTGIDVADLIRVVGESDIAPETPVSFECHDGTVYESTYGELASLGMSSYDNLGQPAVRGLPALLTFGCDGLPNARGGALGLVFGQRSAADDNASRMLEGITRICVGNDVSYSMHQWSYKVGSRTVDYADMAQISGGELNGQMGQSTLHVRFYVGENEKGELVRESLMTLPQIEELALSDKANIQRGFYSTYLYENLDEATSGPFTDYYEGYDLYELLKACGAKYVEGARVQFYQSGLNGLSNSWKTINVSLDYLAGNGPAGVGDYSNNFMRYAGDGYVSSGTIDGMRPMLVWGKNGLPLVWGSGTDGVDSEKYNYRGPMIALLPENSVEGGTQVGAGTAASCYLGLIDVYMPTLPADFDEGGTPSAEEAALEQARSEATQTVSSAEKALSSGIVASDDGKDVAPSAKWVPTAVAKELEDALAAARALAADPNADAAAVAKASARVQAALDAYNAAAKAGSKPEALHAGNVSVPTTAKPSVVSGLVYDGKEHAGVVAGKTYVLSGTFKATAAGSYVAYAVPAQGYVWSDGTSGKVAVKWSIARARIAKPTSGKSLVYTGAKQVGVKAGTGYTVAGGSATNAGAYTATATPDANHAWEDGTTGKVSVRYSIAKGAQSVKLAKTKYAKKFGAKAFSLSAKASGGGKLSYTTSNKKVVTVSKAGKVTIKGAGKATITVKALATSNRKASAAKKVTVTVAKAANTMRLSAKTKTLKYAKVKKAKQTVKPLVVKLAKGKLTYTITKINGKKYTKSAFKKNIRVTRKGAVVVAKATRKATYKVTIRVKAAGNANYKAKTVTKTVKVKVK